MPDEDGVKSERARELKLRKSGYILGLHETKYSELRRGFD